MPYVELDQYVKKGGLLGALASRLGKEIVLYCTFGERSVLALQTMRTAGFIGVRHVQGGLDAWVKAGRGYVSGPLRPRARAGAAT